MEVTGNWVFFYSSIAAFTGSLVSTLRQETNRPALFILSKLTPRGSFIQGGARKDGAAGKRHLEAVDGQGSYGREDEDGWRTVPGTQMEGQRQQQKTIGDNLRRGKRDQPQAGHEQDQAAINHCHVNSKNDGRIAR